MWGVAAGVRNWSRRQTLPYAKSENYFPSDALIAPKPVPGLTINMAGEFADQLETPVWRGFSVRWPRSMTIQNDTLRCPGF